MHEFVQYNVSHCHKGITVLPDPAHHLVSLHTSTFRSSTKIKILMDFLSIENKLDILYCTFAKNYAKNSNLLLIITQSYEIQLSILACSTQRGTHNLIFFSFKQYSIIKQALT